MSCICRECESGHSWRKSFCRCRKHDDAALQMKNNQRCKKSRKDVASTSVPPILKPRYDNALLYIAVWAVVKHSVGILFTAFVFIVLLISAPFVLIFRYLHFARYRTQPISAPFTRHCDIWWPLRGAPARAILTLRAAINVELFTLQMNNILKLEERESCNCFEMENSMLCAATAVVDVCDQKKVRLKTINDLIVSLNDASSLLNIKAQSTVHTVLVPSFCTASDRRAFLAIITHSVDCFPYCLPRLLSLYTEGRLVFDIEPKMGESFTPRQESCNMCSRLAQIVQFTCIGPLAVLLLAFRKPNSIWSEINLETLPTSSFRRMANSDEDADEAVLMENVGDEKKKPLSNRHVYRWLRIPQTDQLNRAERILRAASIELFLAFVAGTLRRHFRFLGIMHPTDIGAAVPISYREFVPVEAQKPCDTMLLPIQIPCGVEGAIPRIWAVQRRLAGGIEGVVPTALRVSRFLCDLSLSPDTSRTLFTSLYADSCVVVSLLRTSGDVELDSRHIQSILLYPSIPVSIKAAFTFVQSDTDVMLSLSLCQQYFPDPDKLLLHFKTEVLCLLDQLATRLLTLSQATFLPARLPFLCETVDETDRIKEVKREKELTINITENQDYMDVHELQKFVTSIQKELDELRMSRDASHIDKEEYVKKLTELESQMKTFHDNMARRLGSPVLATLREDAELASSAVAELLAPYREECGGTRRFSREFLLTDVIRRSSESNITW